MLHRTAPILGSLVFLAPLATAGGGVQSYCQSGANGATISATGSAFLGANDLVLHADGVPTTTVGIFYYGDGQTQGVPFGNGFRCVSGSQGVFRLGLVAPEPGTQHVSFPLDYGAQMDPAGQIAFNSTWFFQFWFRDGASWDLTDALQIHFGAPENLPVLRTLAEGPTSIHPLAQTGGFELITDPAAWQTFWDQHTAVLGAPLPQVDFQTEMVIAYFAGTFSSVEAYYDVTSASLSVTSVNVGVEIAVLGPFCPALPVVNMPFEFVAVPRVEDPQPGLLQPSIYFLLCP